MSTELEHAIRWIKWVDAGEPKDQCPWKNPYQFKKHRPKPEMEARAREIVESEKIEKN
jgi:hypothetical protein